MAVRFDVITLFPELFAPFQQVGVTVLIATHDLALIKRADGRVLRLEGGTLVEGGDAA